MTSQGAFPHKDSMRPGWKRGIFKWSSILQLQVWDSREIRLWAEIAFPPPSNLSFRWIWKSYLSLSGSRTWEERLSEFSAKQHVQITALIPLNCSPREGRREEKTKRNFSTDGYLLFFFSPYLSVATKITLKTNHAAFVSGEISITSDMQMTPPLWQKVKRN